MNIAEEISFDKEGHIERFPIFRKLFLTLIIILVAALSFGIGRLTSSGSRGVVKVEYDQTISNYSNKTSQLTNLPTSNSIVASKNGSKYHYLNCPGAKQIKEENKLTFATVAAAEAAGYTLASNCLPP